MIGAFGGALVLGGCVACLVAMAIVGAGDRAGSGLYGIAMLVVPAALIPVGIGAIILGVRAPRPFDGRPIRIGLTLLGVGLLGYLAANYIPAPEGMNTLQSWPHIIGLTVGALATALGVLVTGLALVRSPSPLRLAGTLLVAGLVLLPFGLLLASMTSEGRQIPIAVALEVLGFAGVVLGGASVGALAIAADRSSAAANG